MKPLSVFLVLSLVFSAGFLRAQEEEKVTIRKPNAPVTEILDDYQQMTGKRLIRDANLAGLVNLNIDISDMPKSEAIRFIEAVLLLNGVSFVPAEDNTVKVLNITGGKNPRMEAVPLIASASQLPKGEQVVSYFMPLRYLSAQEAQTVFQAQMIMNAYSGLVPVQNAQALILTEKASVLRQLIKLQELIDVPPAKVTSEFVQLERADAERVAETVISLLEKRRASSQQSSPPGAVPPPGQGQEASVQTEKALVAGETQLVPDPRTNRILVVTRPVNIDYLKGLIKEFDQAVDLVQPLERPLKYVSAAEVLPVLQNILTETKDQASPTGGGAQGGQQRPGAQPAAQARPAAGGGTGSTGGDQLTLGSPNEDTAPESVTVGKTRLIADKKANSILVIGPPESVGRVKMILDRLDKRPLQVYLSTVIGELELRDGSEVGMDIIQNFSGGNDAGGAASSRNRSDPVVNPKTLTNPLKFPAISGVTLYGTFLDALNVYVKLLETTNRFKIISRPVVYTANNKKAIISSGQQIPVPTSTLSSLTGGADDSTAVTSNIDYRDVELKLEIIPLINSDKEVTLEIAQSNDSVGATTVISGNEVPSITKQRLTTTVTVANKGTVVLGGLVSEEGRNDITGAPWISRIPVIGLLFKDTKKNKVRKELVILMQPNVIDGPESLEEAQRDEIQRTKIGAEAVKMSTPLKAIPLEAEKPLAE
jgi:general secretion pathway protein D